ncbi:MAG: hypothetical protein VB067_14140 [Christensenellaceae bacterium]|nr:hypothetical protein [Christensenellaceae bacterium]MEA5070132.1 hypothetical protein [Christensenellaceae bacterium]
MAKKSIERNRIRAARYAPGARYDEVIEMTLRMLPKRKRVPPVQRLLCAGSIAAAVVLLLAFAGPPLAQAASRLYERWFGRVVEEIRDEQALPEAAKVQQRLEANEAAIRTHGVEGASAQIGDVTMSVASMSLVPADRSADSAQGDLSLSVTYSKIPPFDPNWVDFSVVVDGREIPMQIDEEFKANYRDRGVSTLTEADWTAFDNPGHSWMYEGVPTTFLSFDVDDWRWDEPRQLTLKAMIDEKPVSIPFGYDPVKAHEEAIESAKCSVALMADNYAHEKAALDAMEAGAVPIGLSGSAQGYDWAIPEMSYADEKLSFVMTIHGIQEADAKHTKLRLRFDDITVDGVKTAGIGGGNLRFEDGNISTIYECALGRDARRLPDESLILMTVRDAVIGEQTSPDSYSIKEGEPFTPTFKYNWAEKRAILPANEAEVHAWAQQARTEHDGLYSALPEDGIAYDLRPLNLTQQADGVHMTITGARFHSWISRLEFMVDFEGKSSAKLPRFLGRPVVTIDGRPCYGDGGSSEYDVVTSFAVKPSLSIFEFGQGEKIVFELPLIDKHADFDRTNYPEPTASLRYEFVIDKSMLKQMPPR